MILLPNFLANKFRYFDATNGYFFVFFFSNIFYLCLSYRSMKYDTLPFHGERLLQKKFDYIWFSFLTSLAFIEVYFLAMIAICVICFTGKISRVHTSVVVWN